MKCWVGMVERGLIVSCQALPDEPLHSPFIMGRMALAAQQAGAVGIRANSVPDILEIRNQVKLPVIGLIKKTVPDTRAYITPTLREVEELVRIGVDIIALDATEAQEETYLAQVRQRYPRQAFMADVSTEREGLRADALGFDYVGPTMAGYTEQSRGVDRLQLLDALLAGCTRARVLAEGGYDTPEQAAGAIARGAWAVVVGSAITRPQVIAGRFARQVKEALRRHNATEE